MKRALPGALAALAIAGCGGTDPDAAVRGAVERAFARDAVERCAARTARLLGAIGGAVWLDPATQVRRCRDRQRAGVVDVLGRVEVSDVERSGRTATATATLRDGHFAGQALAVDMVETRDGWQVDRFDGVRVSARLRARMHRSTREAVVQGTSDPVLAARRADCSVERFSRAISAEEEAQRLEGKLPLAVLRDALDRARKRCYDEHRER